jgi:hypothetical protein
MRKAKPKKRGRKAGVKVGPYKKRKAMTLNEYADTIKVGDKLTFDIPKYSPAPVLTLCGQLEDSILLLENRISNAIAKINSLM